MNDRQRRFPIGEFQKPNNITQQQIDSWIQTIADFPRTIQNLTSNLTQEQLAWKYRSGGWTIAQVIHHCADSHMNSFIRFKLALTEDKPHIRPYDEAAWAELPDTLAAPIQDSIQLLDSLHKRWTILLKNLSPIQLKREFIHPEHNQSFSLEENIGIYAWHCDHHRAHIELAISDQIT